MTTMPVFSFCVRCMLPDVTEEQIRQSFANIGKISTIDFVSKNTKPDYNGYHGHFKMAFIHLESWHSEYSESERQRLIENVETDGGYKIYYDNYKYFVVRKNLRPLETIGDHSLESRVKELQSENLILKLDNAMLVKKIQELDPFYGKTSFLDDEYCHVDSTIEEPNM